MRVFFDFEFASLANPAPISIGLAAEDGARLYAEIEDGWSRAECAPWTIEHVLPLLDGQTEPAKAIRQRILAFLADYPEGGQLICDQPQDKACFGRLIGPPPAGWVFQKSAYTLNSHGASYFAVGETPHHAGNDAAALRALVLAKLADGEDFALLDVF